MKRWLVPLVGVGAALGLAAAVIAQIESGDRGVAPLDSSGSFEVGAIAVDVRATSAEAARLGGWRIAQRKGWQQLWANTHGGAGGAPALSDDALDAIVAGIVVENEQIGPTRYVAKLGVLFDRARAGQILGVTGLVTRSAPMLVIPVQWSGGSATTFEQRTEWQQAWARFRSGNSAIDYVRPSGTGSDPLLLNYGQTQRVGRGWWRMLFDQYGAADVLMPQVRVERSWPGGPVTGYFAARHGPGGMLLSGFVLRVVSSDQLPAMLDEGVRRIDRIYADALAMGQLRPDAALFEAPAVDPASLVANTTEAVAPDAPPDTADATDAAPPTATPTAFALQVDTPDVGSVPGIEASIRGIPGVRGATTTSLALGGTSVMSVTFAGDLATLRLALEARGFRVSEAGGGLRIRR